MIHFMAKSKTVFICQNCGAKETKWTGRCNVCGEWNSFVEEVEVVAKGRGNAIIGTPSSKALRLSEIRINADERMDTGDQELNRVLGGGMVPGSMILLGGEPGIGKSTLVLQFALYNRCGKVLYVSGEESISQISGWELIMMNACFCLVILWKWYWNMQESFNPIC